MKSPDKWKSGHFFADIWISGQIPNASRTQEVKLNGHEAFRLHCTKSFPIRISSVKVIKSA